MMHKTAKLFKALKEGIISFTGAQQDVHTPVALVEEILSKIDLNDKKILVIFNLEFVISLIYTYNVDPSNITFYSDHENKSKMCNMMGVKYITNLEIDMKFDVVVGNPPYQRKNNAAKRWTLWPEFVKTSLKLADVVALVVPQSLTSPGEMFDLIKNKCSVLNVDVNKHFNVGSTFCYFIAHSNRQVTSTTIITDEAEYIKDISQLPFLPLTIDDETLTQLNQLIARPKKIWKRGELHTSNKHLFSNSGKYAVMHTNAQQLKTNTEHKNKSKIRVAVSLSGYPKFKVIQNQYVSQACFWTEFTTLEDATNFANECNGDIIQGMLQVFKWSGWNSKSVIQRL
jgi:hypothetical protein